MSYDKLTVVTSTRWVAEDLASAGTFRVVPSVGLDVPDLTGSALWCSGSWALRLAKSGIAHPFLAPGPAWLPRVPQQFLRRDVWAGTVNDMPYKGIEPMFYKLAEHKHSGIPAGLHLGRRSFRSRIFDALVLPRPVSTTGLAGLHYVGSARMDYAREYRCFVAGGKVTASSFYLATVPGIHDSVVTITWDAYDPAGSPDASVAAAFAQAVVDAMGDDQPPGYTLDVGEDSDGNFSVIEANAAWSSNIYHAPAAGVIDAILASQEPGHPEWAWTPDETFLARARALPDGARQ